MDEPESAQRMGSENWNYLAKPYVKEITKCE